MSPKPISQTRERRSVASTRAFLLLIMLFFAAGMVRVSAQTGGKVTGTIRDQETGEPLIGCNVVLMGTSMGASTDLDGVFFVLNIPAGKYDVQISMLGYQKKIEKGVIVNSGRTTVVDQKLKSTMVEQDAVIVEAVRPDVEPEKTSTSTVIRTEDVSQIAGMRTVTNVIGLAADVSDGHFRGGRSGEELYTLQGMGIVNPLNSTSAFVPIMSAVEEVEVITSGFDAQYGNAQSGVVNISMKEGKSDRWHSNFESRVRLPQRKHFGPSVFDPSANYYLAKMLNPEVWKNGDLETGLPFFSSLSNVKDGYAKDTIVQIQVAMALWKLQMKRDLYRSYGKELDYSVEGGAGGPVSDKVRMFIALQSNVTNPVFPTEQPDIQRQVMGNVVSDMGGGMTLRLSGSLAQNNENIFPSSSGLGYYNWLWDRILGVQYEQSVNSQGGVRFAQTLSNNNSFYEVKFNVLRTSSQFGSSPWPSSIADSLISATRVTSAQNLSQYLSGPDYFSYLRGNDDFRKERTLTMSLEGSYTSQVTKNHMVNAGIQANQYQIFSEGYYNTSATLQTRNYSARPSELGLYVQDKMEFEGMIAKIGLRWDLWNADKDYYTDQFNPFGVRDTSGIVVSNPQAASKAKPPILGRLQPRAGISFPVDVNTVFHLNYGAFLQRPSFQYIVASQLSHSNLSVSPLVLGNPRLKPQVTNSYDVGMKKGLGEGFTLDVSGYYKDVRDLVEMVNFVNLKSLAFSTYVNRDYADIRGFRIALEKRKGNFTCNVNYQFGVATGKSATVSNASPIIRQDSVLGVVTELTNVPTRDILLDFDRTHNLVVTLGYRTDDEWGPVLWGGFPLANWSVSSYSTARSGRPYTPSTNTKLLNSARTPAEYNTNLKVSKRIHQFYGTEATFYLEVFNLFDQRILNYSYLFPKVNAGQSNSIIEAYDHYPIDDRNNGVLFWNDTNRGTGFPVDQSFLVYDNSPRSFTVGMMLEF